MHRKTFRPRGWGFALLVLAVVSTAHWTTTTLGFPQQTGAELLPPIVQSHTIRVESNLVAVPVSVTDAGGMLVKNLQPQDFALEENGKPHAIARIAEPGEAPLDLALLFDISGSVHQRFGFEKQAASRFLQKIKRAEDAALIMAIGQEPQLIHPRSESVAGALQALDRLQPTLGSTAFYDAVVAAARILQKNPRPQGRRVVLVLSDGEDNSSAITSLSDVIGEVLKNDCVFYSINPGGPSIRLNKISREGQEGMERLAAETGGMAFIPEAAEKLDAIFDQIGAELQAQYLLEYYSSDAQSDGKFRRIVVRVPSRPDLRIRARLGYYAPKF